VKTRRDDALDHVLSRRRQLVSLVLVLFVLIAAGVVVVSMAAGREESAIELLDFDVLRISFVGLAIIFALYVWQKERDLRRTEQALIEAQERAGALRNRLRELSALTDAGHAVSATLSLDHVLQVIVGSAKELLGATEASVMLLDPEEQVLRLAATVGLPDELLGQTVPVGDSVAGWVAAQGKPIMLQGQVPEDRFPHFVTKVREVRSAISAPLLHEREPVGVLNISITEGERIYTDQDIEALTVFAGHAATAITNAQAYEQEKQARARLAEADAQRREFVAALTHDLKAPLTSILGYTRLLSKGKEHFTEEQSRGFVDVIDRQGQKILDMVQRLVMATRLEEAGPVLERERLDIPEIVADQVEMVQGMLGERTIETRFPDDLPEIYGDRASVEHALVNLLDNAIKYSDDGTGITVEVLAADGEVLFSVIDEGPGIAEDLLPHVFERYRRGAEDGDMASVGLGLFIVHSLAAAQGGRAWAENEPDRGARITFSLPYRRER